MRVTCRLLSSSSNQWLARQAKDPFVRNRGGYRARSAFKLEEIEAKYQFLNQPYVRSVVDLGAAPGGWSQVVSATLGWTKTQLIDEGAFPKRGRVKGLRYGDASDASIQKFGTWSDPEPAGTEQNAFDPLNIDEEEEMTSQKGRGQIVALDLLPISPIPGVTTIQNDFLSPDAAELVHNALACADNPEGKADVVLSDIAANLTGNGTRDSQSSLDVCLAVYSFACQHLRTSKEIGNKRGGALLLKHFAHPLLLKFREENLEPYFHQVKYIKPASSRTRSSEAYWLCEGWKGRVSYLGEL